MVVAIMRIIKCIWKQTKVFNGSFFLMAIVNYYLYLMLVVSTRHLGCYLQVIFYFLFLEKNAQVAKDLSKSLPLSFQCLM